MGGSGGFTNDRAAIEDLRHRIAGLRAQFPGVHAGVTGGPALSNDEMRAAFDDSKLATALAFALTLGLLLVAFRRVAQPLAMLAVLALSLLWSLGLITLTVGHLTVFSVMFISIVIGLGIDYGIYVLFRQNDEVALGRDVAAALDITATRTGPGVLLGALTAAATFYVLLLTDFCDPAGYSTGIRSLLSQGHQVHMIHVVAREELEPPERGLYQLVDLESGERRTVPLSPGTVERCNL